MRCFFDDTGLRKKIKYLQHTAVPDFLLPRQLIGEKTGNLVKYKPLVRFSINIINLSVN